MLNPKFIRENSEKVKKACQDKGVDPKIVDKLLEIDKRRREHIKLVEEKRQALNEATDLIKKEKTDKKRLELIAHAQRVKRELSKLEPQLKKDKKDFQDLLSQIPNLPAKDVKYGKNEKENKVEKRWGRKPKFDYKPRNYLELGERLDVIDVKRTTKVSGTRFGCLKNEAVLLEFALIQLVLKTLIREGFIPVIPPTLTKVPVFHKLGYSQFTGNEDYYLVCDPKKENPQEKPDYYLIGTAEHAIVPIHQDEILNYQELPKRYLAFSSAFRREAGSWGKDTRGIFRVHQFDKLEMVSFIEPQKKSDKKEHQYLLSLAEKMVKKLKLPYQIVKMCSGDLGHPTARKYDIECWFPAEGRYRETHSISTCTDYQSRSLNIKYVDKKGERNFVHVLNGTAFAIGRIILAILENYQQKDGLVKVPKVLQKYVGKKIIGRN